MIKNGKNKKYLLFYLIPIVALGYLFYQNTKPVLEINYNIKGKTGLISELVPLARVGNLEKDENGYYRAISDEPVYLDVRAPRKYIKAEIQVEYSDLENDIFEVGVARDGAKKNFDFFPLENKILDGLEWSKTEGEGLVLYQRTQKYKTVENFLKNPGAFSDTLIYRTDLSPIISVVKSGNTTISLPIKEKLKLLVYGKNIKEKIEADGDYKINETDLGNNLYKIELVGGKDTIFKKIEINTPFVAITDGFVLGEIDAPVNIYFGGSRLLAKATSASGTQDLTIAENGKKSTLEIKNPLEQYKKIFSGRNIKKIFLEKGDIELAGNLFFINSDNIFYPKYESLYPGINLEKTSYILANYEPPAGDSVKTATAAFDISSVSSVNHKIRFSLSLPNSQNGELVKIRSIKIKFEGEPYGIKKIAGKLLKLFKK